jgi:hypothetical protein
VSGKNSKRLRPPALVIVSNVEKVAEKSLRAESAPPEAAEQFRKRQRTTATGITDWIAPPDPVAVIRSRNTQHRKRRAESGSVMRSVEVRRTWRDNNGRKQDSAGNGN